MKPPPALAGQAAVDVQPEAARRWFSPAAVVAACLGLYIAAALALNGWDAAEMARLGLRYRAGDTLAQPPYDGQFAYYIALDPAGAAPYLDVPAYRYQRILLPLAARVLALGQSGLMPWTLLIINLGAQVAGTWAFGELLAAYGASRWYAIVFGLWAGSVYAVRLALAEPLAYGLAAGALLASRRGREGWAAVLYGLALFAKETTLLFVAAHLAWLALHGDWRGVARLAAVAVLPFAAFQLCLLAWFGRVGLGSGGDLSTPFEIIPFMGLLRIGAINSRALALFAAILGPLVVWPTVWGLVAAARRLWQRDFSLAAMALAANAGFIPFTPFSTFREPLGMLRLATGLVMALVLFGAYRRSRRVLNYSVLWLAALAFLINDR
jgi:hypothetical protein